MIKDMLGKHLDAQWELDDFANLKFGDYLNRE